MISDAYENNFKQVMCLWNYFEKPLRTNSITNYKPGIE